MIGGKAQSLRDLEARFRVPRFLTINAEEVESFKAIPQEVIDRITSFSDGEMIVRSSAIGEDSASRSFAGIFRSARFRGDPRPALRSVISAARSPDVQAYCKAHGIEMPRLALIVQEYVEGSPAGVLFTRSDRGPLVAIADSAESVVRGESGTAVPIDESDLDPGQKRELEDVARRLDRLRGPQDVEFVFAPELTILQSRDITRAIDENEMLWDSSNISESYAGVVLPITCSFARIAYRGVYTEMARRSGLTNAQLEEHERTFATLIGFFEGHFYYNLRSWYAMISLFPGASRNKRNLERMISLSLRGSLPDHRVPKGFRIRYPFVLLARLMRFSSDVSRFERDMSHLEAPDGSVENLVRWFGEARRSIIPSWSVTVENDFLAMTWLGIFEHLVTDEQARIELLRGLDTVSADQVEALKKLASRCSEEDLASSEAFRDRIERGFPELDAYYERYGGRFAYELRLEAKDLDEDPDHMRLLLNGYRTVPTREIENPVPPRGVLERFAYSRLAHYLEQRERLRLLRSRAFSIIRSVIVDIGSLLESQGVIGEARDVFYLEIEELERYVEGALPVPDLRSIIELRKRAYGSYTAPDAAFVTKGLPYRSYQVSSLPERLEGRACSPGIVEGTVRVFEEYEVPEEPFDILVAKNTDPGWTPLLGLAKGCIIEHGGLLSHAAIVCRELGIPCVINARGATSILSTGDRIMMNGSSGEIRDV